MIFTAVRSSAISPESSWSRCSNTNSVLGFVERQRVGVGGEVNGELINFKELECAGLACRVVKDRDDLEMPAGIS